MKTISLVAILASVMLDLFGSVSSVGGPMSLLLVSFGVMIAVGLYEAWGQGPVGWVVNVPLAIVGGVAALGLMGSGLEAILSAMHFNGRLATSTHPLRFVVDVAIPLATVLGAWGTIHLTRRAARLLARR
jgi:hypothetical protein